MSILTAAIHDVLANDAALAGMLSSYDGQPAVFTVDPAPGNAVLPYVVSAGDVSQTPADTKTTRGREIRRDVRCYAEDSGSAAWVEQVAERVRTLLHRQPMVIAGFVWVLGECSGPIAADEPGAYGRVVTVRLLVEEL